MKKIFRYFASAIVLAGLVFVSCSKEDLVPENPEEVGEHIYTLTIKASKEKAPDTKKLELGGEGNKTLYKKWEVNDEVPVYKGSTYAGTLIATAVTSDGYEATLTGQLTETEIKEEDNLLMKYRSQEYGAQDGTLAGIGSTCDYAEAGVTVATIDESGNITTTTQAMFKSKQAIVKFTLQDESKNLLSASSLKVKAEGMEDITVTPSPAASELFVAIPAIASKSLTLEATVGTDTYTYQKTSATFENSKYYGVSVSMFNARLTPLTLVAKGTGNIHIYNQTNFKLYYKVDNGEEQEVSAGSQYGAGEVDIPVTAGQKVQFFCDLARVYTWYKRYISCDVDCEIYGNIMSLLSKNDYQNKTNFSFIQCDFLYSPLKSLFENNTHIINHKWKKLSLPATTLIPRVYMYLFKGCTGLTSAPELPAPTLADLCYYGMFQGCSGLTAIPELPATTLSQKCYESMFEDCIGLISVPDFSASTTLASGCFWGMFKGCTNLTSAPALPFTTLVDNCYASMFENCTNLKTAPSLPATTLQTQCYNDMFKGCTSLTSAPSLPATTLANRCYGNMFEGCTSLSSAPALSATNLAPSCYYYMFKNCTSLNSAPSLPASNLEIYCYQGMFKGCTSISSAPTLSASTLVEGCYQSMFSECSGLSSAPVLSATALAERCYYWMFENCTSLESAPALPAETLAPYCYFGMFSGCSSLKNAPVLPAMTLADYCYDMMFGSCTALETAPALPATTLAESCYDGMFYHCSSLTTPPSILPATTLEADCYNSMFGWCTSLNQTPVISATTLAARCCKQMFYNCKSLTTAPALSATTLATSCYEEMFSQCDELTTAPDLPAPILVNSCYQKMFWFCKKLSSIKCLATDISATNCLKDWMYDVPKNNTCTFTKAASMPARPDTGGWPNGDSGIPYSWTIVDAS